MELQLHQTEARGNKVLKHTSEVVCAAIQRDLKALREDWMALYDLSLNLNRYGGGEKRTDQEEHPGNLGVVTTGGHFY